MSESAHAYVYGNTRKFYEWLDDIESHKLPDIDKNAKPEAVRVVMKEAVRRTWQQLAVERIDDIEPSIPLGRRFWPLAKSERAEIAARFERRDIANIATALRKNADEESAAVIDAAYWVKRCSSLGSSRSNN